MSSLAVCSCWALATTGSLLLAGSISGSLHVYRTAGGQHVAEVPLHHSGVRDIKCAWAQAALVTGSWDHTFAVCDVLPRTAAAG